MARASPIRNAGLLTAGRSQKVTATELFQVPNRRSQVQAPPGHATPPRSPGSALSLQVGLRPLRRAVRGSWLTHPTAWLPGEIFYLGVAVAPCAQTGLRALALPRSTRRSLWNAPSCRGSAMFMLFSAARLLPGRPECSAGWPATGLRGRREHRHAGDSSITVPDSARGGTIARRRA